MALPDTTPKFRFRENGRRIRAARRLTGLSQENFAPLIGTGRRHMIKLENGEHRPSGELRDRIVEVTGTKEQIESSDDDKEEDLLPRALLNKIAEQMAPLEISHRDLHGSVSEKDILHYRHAALRNLARIVEIQRELA